MECPRGISTKMRQSWCHAAQALSSQPWISMRSFMSGHIERKMAIQQALQELLPAMNADGGGAEIVLVTEDSVTLRLTGTCLFCPSRNMSAAALADGLKQRIPHVKQVFIDYPPLKRLPVHS